MSPCTSQSVQVQAYRRAYSECTYGCVCLFAKLYMHECASQSVCASAAVSTPPGLCTKPAQRQMGNFLRGKGKKSGAAAKAAGCVSFPARLESDRVKDTETLRYLRTVGEKIKETAWGKKKRKRFSLVCLLLSFPSISSHSLLLKNPQPTISL